MRSSRAIFNFLHLSGTSPPGARTDPILSPYAGTRRVLQTEVSIVEQQGILLKLGKWCCILGIYKFTAGWVYAYAICHMQHLGKSWRLFLRVKDKLHANRKISFKCSVKTFLSKYSLSLLFHLMNVITMSKCHVSEIQAIPITQGSSSICSSDLSVDVSALSNITLCRTTAAFHTHN